MLCPTLGSQLAGQQLPDVSQLFWSAPPRWVCSLQYWRHIQSSRPFHQVCLLLWFFQRDHTLPSYLLLCQELCPHLCPCIQRLTHAVSCSGNASSEALLQPLAGAVGQLWSQRQRPSATCATWSGFHYQTFDGRHYHFLGRCTYLLAGAADSTWAVHLRPRVHCSQPGHCWLVREREISPEEVWIRWEGLGSRLSYTSGPLLSLRFK